MTHPQPHVIVGPLDQVSAALQRAHIEGRLASIGHIERLPNQRVRVTAQLRPPPAEAGTGRWQRVRPWLICAAWLLGLATLAGLAWLIVLAVLAVISAITVAIAWIGGVLTWIGAHLIGITILGAGLLILTAGGSRCAGFHCNGFRH
jgi:hypothetical protein